MADIMAGAEPWSHHPVDAAETAEVGVLVLHGFTGNPSAVRPLAAAAAATGHAVEAPLLPGHGRTWQEMSRTTWHQWAAASMEAYDDLRCRTRRQVVVGLSMGGTLALHLAATRGPDIAGLVLINPAVQTRDPRLKLLWLLKWMVPSLPGVASDIANPERRELAYERVPLRAVSSMLALQRRVRAGLHLVEQPTLVFTSRVDHVVDPRDSTLVLEGISSRDAEQVWLEHSYHVATLDYDADLVIDGTVAFIERLTR